MTDDERWEALADAAAIGDELSAEDEAFLAAFSDADVERERVLYRGLERLGRPSEIDPDDRARALATIAAHGDAATPSRWSKLGVGLLAAGLAAAAVALLWTRVPSFAPATSTDHGAIVASGALMYDGVELGEGDTLPEHTWVTARGSTCVRLAAGRGCVESGARLRVHEDTIELGDGALHFTGSGRLVLDGETLLARAGSVDLRTSASRAEVQVLEGTVEVRGIDGDSTVLQQGAVHEVGSSRAASPPSEVEDAVEIDPVERDTEVEPEAAPAGEAVEARTRPSARTPRSTAAELLSAARRQVADGKLAKASSTYAALRRQYPSSGEAQAANVSIGQLELRRGRDKSALRAFSRYLERGGPLAEEAHWGKIRALHRLGREAQRDAAIKALRAASPSSVYLKRAVEL